MTSWGKLRRLAPAEIGILASAFFLLPLINILLRALGYSCLHRLIEKLTPIHHKCPITAESMATAKSVARMTAVAANRGLYRATCLRKSLLVLWFLRWRGIAGTIRFGVRLECGVLKAHAWIEWQGEVINDEADVRERYVPLENGFPQTQAGL